LKSDNNTTKENNPPVTNSANNIATNNEINNNNIIDSRSEMKFVIPSPQDLDNYDYNQPIILPSLFDNDAANNVETIDNEHSVTSYNLVIEEQNDDLIILNLEDCDEIYREWFKVDSWRHEVTSDYREPVNSGTLALDKALPNDKDLPTEKDLPNLPDVSEWFDDDMDLIQSIISFAFFTNIVKRILLSFSLRLVFGYLLTWIAPWLSVLAFIDFTAIIAILPSFMRVLPFKLIEEQKDYLNKPLPQLPANRFRNSKLFIERMIKQGYTRENIIDIMI
jgi:hypothetical protein